MTMTILVPTVGELADPRQSAADQDLIRRQFPLGRGHQGVVGLDRRIVVVAPQPAPNRADAADLSQGVEPGGRQQVVTTRDQPLHDDFRRILQ